MGDDGRLRPAWGGLAVSGRLTHQRPMTAELIRVQQWELSLNQALLRADIHFGPEPFVAAFDRFYADELEIRSNDNPPVKGKPANRQMLASFLLPIHVVVEAGAATLHSFEMEESWIEPDGSCISNWRADITGPVDSGRRTLRWMTKRVWRAGQVVYEEHRERQDLRLVPARHLE